LPIVGKNEKIEISLFIITSTAVFIALGNPVKLLVLAGAINGLILPIVLAVMLLAANRSSIIGTYKHPLLLQFFGWLVVAVMSWMGYITIQQSIGKLF